MSSFDPISVSLKQQLLSQLCERLDDAIFILDSEFRYLSVNATYEIMIGYNKSFLIGRSIGIYAAEFLSIEEQSILEDIVNCLDSTGFYEKSFSMATRYGQMLECYMTYRKICVEQSTYYVGMVRDMSSIIKDRKQVAHLLNYDQLTGLPNRKVFLSQASELLSDNHQKVVVVRFNIDRYRSVASMIGPNSINTLMKSFVMQINRLKLDNLLCFSHFGGDDFGLLFGQSKAHMVRHQLERLMQMCEQPFLVKDDLLQDTTIHLNISVGVSCFPEHGNQSIDLLIKAETALQYVKQYGGNDVCWYNDIIQQTTADSLKLEAELRVAASDGQFLPYYQPKVCLSTGAITGFEALVRWQHPSRGLLEPIDFIDAILTHKLSFDLFYQMAVQIAQQLSIWQALGFSQHICINADVAEFSYPKFFDVVSSLLTQHDIQAHSLHIEMTETSLIKRHDNVKKQLGLLKELGVRLALDDFGTGYASLSYLQEYPFDFIKIDKSFISKIVTDRTQRAIVKAILDLADALDMEVVAEGIETEQQRDLLLQMGCAYGQGYWFGRPVTADMATEMLLQQQLSQ